jgi:hypothetical protein
MVKAVTDKTKKAATKVAVKKAPAKKTAVSVKVAKPVKTVKVVKGVSKQPKEHSITVPDLSVPMGLAREALASI